MSGDVVSRRMVAFKDMTGLVFGRLTVLGFGGRDRQGIILWNCSCSCGGSARTRGASLRSGHASSCGCLQRDIVSLAGTTHGNSGTRTYKAWHAMIDRCTNPHHASWKYYGGRGVIVRDRWKSLGSFTEDMGQCPCGLTLDRIDSKGNYEPGNCRWATPREQANNRRTNRRLELNGSSRTVSEWAEILGISQYSLRSRLWKGWSDEEALTTPFRSYRKKYRLTPTQKRSKA